MSKKQTFNCAIPLGMTGVSLGGPSFAGGNTTTASGFFQEFGELSTADAAILYVDVLAIYGSGLSMTLSVAEKMPIGRDAAQVGWLSNNLGVGPDAFIIPTGYTTNSIATPNWTSVDQHAPWPSAQSLLATGSGRIPTRLVIDPVYGIIHQLQWTITGGASLATTTIPSSISTTQTAITVGSIVGFADGDVIQIGASNANQLPELAIVNGAPAGTSIPIIRGQFNTFGVAWSATTTVAKVQGFAINATMQSIHRS